MLHTHSTTHSKGFAISFVQLPIQLLMSDRAVTDLSTSGTRSQVRFNFTYGTSFFHQHVTWLSIGKVEHFGEQMKTKKF